MRERVYETHKKENKYDLSGKYGIGYTYKGDEFYFDLDDYTLIKEHCWCIDHEGYVSTNLWVFIVYLKYQLLQRAIPKVA